MAYNRVSKAASHKARYEAANSAAVERFLAKRAARKNLEKSP